jgi:hypothetical protein
LGVVWIFANSFRELYTSFTCKLRTDELSYCKNTFLEVMTVKKQDFIGKNIKKGFLWKLLSGLSD